MKADIFQPFAFERKDDVLILHFLGPAETNKILWPPSFQKAQQRSQAFVIGALQRFIMSGDEGRVLLGGSLTFAGRYTQHIGGLVPKEVGRDA